MKSTKRNLARDGALVSDSARRDPCACTVICANQLASARVLASSYLQYHPRARFYALVIDTLPTEVTIDHHIRLVEPTLLNLPYLREFLFMYDVGELCKALRPAFLRFLLNQCNETEIICFDSEILVTSRLQSLLEALPAASIVLPPHLGDAIPESVEPSQREVLAAGAYRPGLVAIRKSVETLRFLGWWEAWLHDKCRVGLPDALVIDPTWLDIVKILFPVATLKDPSYQVPYWQTHSPVTAVKGGRALVNKRPIALFHFGAFDGGQESSARTPNASVSGLHDKYVQLRKLNGSETAMTWRYGFRAFNGGTRISLPIRKLYAELDPRRRAEFGDPFESKSENSFFAWATKSGPGSGLSPFLSTIYKLRPDVAQQFPAVEGQDRDAFLFWAFREGAAEFDYDPDAMKVNSGSNAIHYDPNARRVSSGSNAIQPTSLGSCFDNGVAVNAPMRKLYLSLSDRQRARFGDPLRTQGENSFLRWATQSEASNGLSPFLRTVYSIRPDAMSEFPDVEGRHKRGFLEWASGHGAAELGYDPIAMGVQRDDEEFAMLPVATALACSIVIPVCNKASITRNCLNSLFQASFKSDFEVIVVDDASTDSTTEILEGYGDRIRVVRNEKNAGFAASCNAGARVAKGRALVFLNNDTISKTNWLDALVRYAGQHPEVAIIGSKLLFPNETIQHAGMVICEDREPRHIYEGFPADHPAVNKSRRFQVVTGACFFIRREDFEQAGGFDLGFRNGYEDVDLCLRVGALGREIHYCHESVLYHLEAVSRNVKAEEPSNEQLYRTRWADQIHPDEFSFYVQDDLLRIDYKPFFPMAISISPLLAVSNNADREDQVNVVLHARSRQVFSLLKDNIRLGLRVEEAELQSTRSTPPQYGLQTSFAAAATPELLVRGQIHRLSRKTTNRLISILLPVKNGAAKLRTLLPAILSQDIHDHIEIIAVDSGSSDESVELLRQSHATVISIDSRSFNHGSTRNLAASYASGTILVFLNQSALPADRDWLKNLTEPLRRDPDLAGVCSRILPRKDADVLVARDISRNINASNERIVAHITDWDYYHSLKKEELRRFVNFHTLSSAIRTDVFRKLPFREARFAEDLIWGKDALESGLRLQFEPTSVALHSHNYSVLDIFRRNFDDGSACQEIVSRTLEEDAVVPSILHQVRDDWRYLERECGLRDGELEDWRLISAMRRTAQWIGHWIGVNSANSEQKVAALLSGVEQIKAGRKTEITDMRVRGASSTG